MYCHFQCFNFRMIKTTRKQHLTCFDHNLLHKCVCVCVCMCACVCVDSQDTGSNPMQSRRKQTSTSTPAHPSVKRVPGLVLGAKYTGCVSLMTKGVGGAHTYSESHSWCSCEFLAWLQKTAQHRHTVPAWCTGVLALPGTRDPCGS